MTLLLQNRFAIFVFSFLLLTCFRPQKRESHMENMIFFFFFFFVLLIRWTSKWELHFLLFFKIIKSHILLKPIVPSLLSFSCKTASKNIYVQSTFEIYDVIGIIFFTQLNMLRKMVLLWKKRMLASLGVSVAVMFLLVVLVVYCFVMKKKKGKEL